jgi:DNA-binding GntR family transcriptional regulator
VREALRQLETEGLVTYQRNRGAVVSGMDVTQICELLDIRVALECHAARLGVPNMVQQDFQQMQEILDAYSKSESLVEWAEYNRRFHLALCAPANNKRLRRLIEEFCLNTDRYTHEQMSLATGKDSRRPTTTAFLKRARRAMRNRLPRCWRNTFSRPSATCWPASA